LVVWRLRGVFLRMELEVNLGSVCFWLFFLWCSAYWRLCFVVLLFSASVRLVQIPIFNNNNNNNNIFVVKKNPNMRNRPIYYSIFIMETKCQMMALKLTHISSCFVYKQIFLFMFVK
jgi:hypothetical protein